MNKKVLAAKNHLSNMNVWEVANAGTPAVPGATFAVMKQHIPEEGQVRFIKTVLFQKDILKKQVFGYVLIPGVADLQGDIITKEEVEKAMHTYMKNGFFGEAKASGISGEHVDFDNMNHPIECAIDLDGAIMKAHGHEELGVDGAWWMGEQCDADTWSAVQKGLYTGFSIGGIGVRTPVEGAEVAKADSFIQKTMAKIVAMCKAEGDAMSFDEVDLMDRVWNELWTKLDQLNYSITTIVGDSEISDKQAAIGASVDEFKASLLGALAISKAGKEISTANMNLIADAVTAAAKFQEAFGGLHDLMERMNSATTEKAITKGDGTMAHTLDSLGQALTDLTKTIDEKVLPVLGEFEEFKKARDAADAGGDDEKADKPAAKTTDGEPTELEKALETALEKQLKPVTDKVDDAITRLAKLEGKPDGQQGGDKDSHDNDNPNFKPAGSDEEIQKARIGRNIIMGPTRSQS